MPEFSLTLAEALTSPLTTDADLDQLVLEAEAAGRTDIAETALAEIKRRSPPHWITHPTERRRMLEEAIESDAAPCDGGPGPEDVR